MNKHIANAKECYAQTGSEAKTCERTTQIKVLQETSASKVKSGRIQSGKDPSYNPLQIVKCLWSQTSLIEYQRQWLAAKELPVPLTIVKHGV
jgi:hypothetical protein